MEEMCAVRFGGERVCVAENGKIRTDTMGMRK